MEMNEQIMSICVVSLGHSFICYKSNVSYVIYGNKAYSDSDSASPREWT